MADPTDSPREERGARRGHRTNVSVPAGLFEAFREAFPDANLSALLHEAMRARLGCDHQEVACARCGQSIDQRAVELEALGSFYREALWQMGDLVRKGGTAEGAQRIFKDVGERFQIPDAPRLPLTRPTRRQRVANKVKDLPPPTPKPAALPAAPALRAVDDLPSAGSSAS